MTTESDVLRLSQNQKLTVTNNSGKELVIGFLKAQRIDNSTTPILDIRGTNVTLFSPEFSNVKKAVTLQGPGHKIIGGTITAVANAADSLCVSGNGSKSEIRNLAINDCANAIRLNGNENVVENVNILPHVGDYARRGNETAEQFKTRILNGRSTWPPGTCLSVTGQGGSIKGVFLDKCYGTGVQILGNGIRVEGSLIQGETEYEGDNARYSSNCLLVKKSSGITLESNEFSNCLEAVRIEESQQIAIGPEKLADFETKHNKLHHNDYAIHAQNSNHVFAWHNSIYENGIGLPLEEAYHFGLWFDSTNYLESALLKDPIFESVEETPAPDAVEVPIVHFTSEGSFVEVRVPARSGWVEVAFPLDPKKPARSNYYQTHQPFLDCPFENAELKEDGYATVTCPVDISDVIETRRVLALVHIDEAGSTSPSNTLGLLNRPTGGILVSLPAPETGSMTAGDSPAGGFSGGATSGGSGGGGGISGITAAGASTSGKASSCALNPSIPPNALQILWPLLPLIYLTLRNKR